MRDGEACDGHPGGSSKKAGCLVAVSPASRCVMDEAGHAQDGLMAPLRETPKISGSGTARAGPWPLGKAAQDSAIHASPCVVRGADGPQL